MTTMPVPLLDRRSSTTQIAEARPELAVLPIGSCEQHGPALPIGTDAMVAETVAREVCERVGALMLPVLAYGTCAEHRGFPGTVSLRPQTLAAVVEDVVQSCVEAGIGRLAILSGHGGNWILRPTTRDINARVDGCSVVVIPETVLWSDSMATDLHAGMTETSMMLHLDAEAVGVPPPDFEPDTPREALDLLTMAQVTPDGVWGAPSKASAAFGEEFLAGMVTRATAYLQGPFEDLVALREGSSR